MMKEGRKLEEIDRILSQEVNNREQNQAFVQNEARLVHTMRAVVVIIDVTRSMGMKDFKPSRLSAAVVAVRQYLRLLKQSTPIAIAALGLSSKGFCKMVSNLTFDVQQIITQLDQIRIQENPGCFSMESSLYQSIAQLDTLKTYYHRQILVLQSSPMTKDQHSLQQTTQILKESDVTLNVISMCGWTEAIKRSVQKLKGKYITVSKAEECVERAKELAAPPEFRENSVRMQLVKMGLVRKERPRQQTRCFCHFKKIQTAYVCTNCECTLCKQPPLQCPMCEILLIMPTDLYNHTIS